MFMISNKSADTKLNQLLNHILPNVADLQMGLLVCQANPGISIDLSSICDPCQSVTSF